LAAAPTDAVAGAILLTETWTISVEKEEDLGRPHGSLEHHPDRQEALMLNALRGSMQLVGLWKINRTDKKLEPIALVDPMKGVSGGGGEGMEGRFVLNQPTGSS
jgi:hypothetical protein